MDDLMWENVDRLDRWIDAGSPNSPEQQRILRVLKVSEEAGEAAQAVIGVTGQNPRKGVSHTWEDVENELVDVALSALVALRAINPQAREVFEARMRSSRAWLDENGL
ncbi:NTP pyrophosphatase (non-canonical NTP hydrolase) [Kitasatospora sp. MAA4]|uniref:MazG-like family protein n=1 Tax=Kitasatospora sp. MAA4 TaxID=3035093 RepID=UPI00247712C7|nr:MazG-like family protein [Kitasatospora sp. MAA4]MDH6134862.1 NTP pyrophosphatase (non-canonical NTP hydrolase) [Kitasatospora sp. MAA4]